MCHSDEHSVDRTAQLRIGVDDQDRELPLVQRPECRAGQEHRHEGDATRRSSERVIRRLAGMTAK
jgi:hypothetical protein